MKLSELFGNAGLPYPPELGDIPIERIVTDSRHVTPGCLFLCIKGLHTDGHDYVHDAIQAGAAVIVAEQVRDVCVGGAAAQIIVLENTRKAAALLYNALYGEPTKKLKIIGVTGTNGKTSVCFLLRELFEAAGYRCGVLGTVCCHSADGMALSPQNTDSLANMTTPDPEDLYRMLSQMAADGVEYVLMEVTSHALALHKVDAIRFDTAVFTNLSRDHLDFHRDMDAYFAAKARLFGMCRRGVVNRDDAYGEQLAQRSSCPIVTCSMGEGDYCALGAKSLGNAGSAFQFKTPHGVLDAAVGIPGRFSVMNALLAGTVALEHGISVELVARTLETTKGVPGRMERVESGSREDPAVLIDYAHTPDALEKLLLSAWEFREDGARITLVFGCGGDRDRGKRAQMARIASRLADFVIVTADNSRGEDPTQIFSDIKKGLDKEKPHRIIPERRRAIEYAVLQARAKDLVILAGKGHERYEIDGAGRHPFDEREIVRDALRKRREK